MQTGHVQLSLQSASSEILRVHVLQIPSVLDDGCLLLGQVRQYVACWCDVDPTPELSKAIPSDPLGLP